MQRDDSVYLKHIRDSLFAAGVGFSRILGLFRLDYTYRFTHPRNSFISLGVAQLL